MPNHLNKEAAVVAACSAIHLLANCTTSASSFQHKELLCSLKWTGKRVDNDEVVTWTSWTVYQAQVEHVN